MADMRLPRFLTDKNAENREVAIVRFAEENNDILRKQFTIMSAMAKSLQHIEDMMFLSLDYEKRKLALSMQDMQRSQLTDLETRREAANEKNRGPKGGQLGGLVSGVAKLGLKAMAGAFLFGFGMELLRWGKSLEAAREKWFGTDGYITRLQNGLDKFGQQVEELTGSKILGGLIKSLIPISAAFAALATIIGPGRAFRLATAPISAIFSAFGAIIKFARNPATQQFLKNSKFLELLDFSKFLKFARVFGKAIPLVGEIILLIEGLIGGIQGAIKGWEEGGIIGAIEGFFTGFIHGVVDSILEILQSVSVWLLEKLGFDELASALDNIDVTKLVDWVISGVANIFSTIGSAVGSFFKAIMDFDYMGFISKVIDSLPLPDIVKSGIKTAISATVQGAKTVAGAVGSAASSAWDATTGAWDAATGWLGKQRDRIDTAAAGMVRSQTAAMNVAKDKKPPTPAAAPITRATGNMARATQESGRIGAVQTGVATMARPETSDLGAPGAVGLEDEARSKGLTQQQINYTYETDRLLGAPQGATLAQLKQESGFNPSARSPTGAVGLAQFTSIAVKDVLAVRRGVDSSRITRDEVAAEKASLQGNVEKSLQFHRDLMQIIQRRKGTDWLQTMRAYNGDVSLERNGMQARDNYIARISGFLGRGGASGARMAGVQAPRTNASGSNLATATDAARVDNRPAGAGMTASVNNSRTNVTNQTTNQAPNISASTPVEFAPHVV